MNEERLRILKMLKEGRITMEEAELLLDALGDPESATQGQRRDAGHERSAGDRWSSAAERFFSGWKGKPGDFFNFDWKLDPQNLQSGIRDAMKGFEQSMKDFAGEFKKMEFPGGFKEFFGRSSGQSSSTVKIPTAGADKVSIHNRWGDMRLTGTDSQEITGTASVTAWAADAEAAEEIADSVELSHYREGDTIVLRCEPPSSRGYTRFRVDLDLNVPAGLALTVKGMSGDFALADFSAGVTAINLSGDIIVQKTNGIIAVESKSGDIGILDCNGEIRAHSLSGDMNLERVRSVMVRVHTVSGDVGADIQPEGSSEIDLQTTSGDVRLTVPDDAGLDLAAETTSGEISCALPAEYSERSPGRIKGTVNGGGTQVHLQTKSGDIRVQS